jgi:hypothetical protein
MAEDTATIAVHNSTMIKTVYDLIGIHPFGILGNAVKNYFNLPLQGNPGVPWKKGCWYWFARAGQSRPEQAAAI